MLIAAMAMTAGAARADGSAPGPTAQLAGDYFVGASVFLFQRTVLAAFAHSLDSGAGSTDSLLDAGAVVLARENAEDESGSVALEAMRGWLMAWLAAKPGAAPPPGFGPERRHAIACLVYGADPDGHADLAQHAKLSIDDRADCVARYKDAAGKWAEWLLPFRKLPGAPLPMRASPEGAPSEGEPVLRLAFAPTIDEGDQAIADAMRKNGLFQLLTDTLNAALAMPRPITALLTQCGEPRAFYNADRGEAVLCYEMLGALLKSAP